MVAKEVRVSRKINEKLSPGARKEFCNVVPQVSYEIVKDMREELSHSRIDAVRIEHLSNELLFSERLREFCPRRGSPL